MAETAKKFVNPFTELDIENDPDLVIDWDREEDGTWYRVNMKKAITLSCAYFMSLYLFVNKCTLVDS